MKSYILRGDTNMPANAKCIGGHISFFWNLPSNTM